MTSVLLDDLSLTPLEAAIVRTVAYVDVFDYPLTAAEIHRFLMGTFASPETVADTLHNGRLIPQALHTQDGYFTLPGRESIITTRLRRHAIAQTLWPHAIHYGRFIAQLPFIRMVAVTGSLAVDNAEANADIDYLIITDNGRLWLSRAFTILIVRLAARQNITLCPNYFLSQRALALSEHNIYTAHELVQMIPLAGLPYYHQLRQLNPWTNSLLPNTQDHIPAISHHTPLIHAPTSLPRRLAEALLRTEWGTRLETWEMKRKIAKLSQRNPQASETAFAPDYCKGHFDGHGRHTLTRFDQRLQTLKESKP